MEVQTSTLPEHMLGAGRLVRGIRKMREAGIGPKPQTNNGPSPDGPAPARRFT